MHLKISNSGSSLTYEPGDVLTVYWEPFKTTLRLRAVPADSCAACFFHEQCAEQQSNGISAHCSGTIFMDVANV